MPLLLWELDCDPNSPLYQECITRFHGDEAPQVGGVLDVTGLDDEISKNMSAIRAMFDTVQVNTPGAQSIKNDFVRWYDDLSWFDKRLQSNYDLARNLRNRFDLANATTPEAKAAVQTVLTTGLSTEQLQGQPDRRDETGMLPGPKVPPKPPLVPTPVLIAGAAVAGLAFVAWAYGEGRGR